MTARLTKPCRVYGCPNLAPYGQTLCPDHQSQQPPSARQQHYLDTNPHYNNPEWFEARDRKRRDHPVCELCGIRPTALIHHIVPLAQGGTHDLDNLLAVCRQCHPDDWSKTR